MGVEEQGGDREAKEGGEGRLREWKKRGREGEGERERGREGEIGGRREEDEEVGREGEGEKGMQGKERS